MASPATWLTVAWLSAVAASVERACTYACPSLDSQELSQNARIVDAHGDVTHLNVLSDISKEALTTCSSAPAHSQQNSKNGAEVTDLGE